MDVTLVEDIDSRLESVLRDHAVSFAYRTHAGPGVADEGEQAACVRFYAAPGEGAQAAYVADHAYFSGKVCVYTCAGQAFPAAVATRIREAVWGAVQVFQMRALAFMQRVNDGVLGSLDDGEIAHRALGEILGIIPDGTAGILRLYDEASQTLVPVSQVGFDSDFYDYRLEPNESIAGRVYLGGGPVLLNSREAIVAAHSNLRALNRAYVARHEIANSLVCVPVMSAQRCLGTLTLLSFQAQAAFGPFSLHLVEAVATQIAIAINKSQLYRAVKASAARLAELHDEIALKNRDLDRSLALHRRLMQIFTASNGLAAKLDRIGAEYDIAFAYRDIFGFVHETAGFDHPAYWRAAEREGYAIDCMGAPGEAPLVFKSVLICAVEIGRFYHAPGAEPADQEAVLEVVASFIALDAVKVVSSEEIINARKKHYFECVIKGAGVYGPGFEFAACRYFHVMSMRFDADLARGHPELFAQQLLASSLKAAWVKNHIAYYTDDEILFLFAAATSQALTRNIEAFAALAVAQRLYVGCGNVHESAGEHYEALRHASECSRIMRIRRRVGLQEYRNLGVERLLLNQSADEIARFADDILAPLVAVDRHGVLLKTLMSYIGHDKSIADTARTLAVHANTLYQRLRRIEEVLDRKLGDSNDYLLVSLACHLRATYGAQPG